jgi:hypothetical protein
VNSSIAIVLRFRDLVTELGGTVAEHRQIMRKHGHVWWGWWRRQAEHIPKNVLTSLFGDGSQDSRVPMVLFDSGTLRVYATVASRIVASPSPVGIQTPEVEITPEYYVRGQYPLWFRFDGDIASVEEVALRIAGKPTVSSDDVLPNESIGDVDMSLEELRDDRPTLWLARPLRSAGDLRHVR